MTEAVNTTAMSKEAFEQHHARTWDYVARVGKVWEGIAEEQQTIIDGRGYRHLNYASHEAYWSAEFQENTGWSPTTIRNWMSARRSKLETQACMPKHPDPGLHTPSGAWEWREIKSIPDPEDRVKFLTEYADLKPRLSDEGVPPNRQIREAIKEFRGDRVRDVLSPPDMQGLPETKLTEEENWVFEAQKISSAIRRLSPENVAAEASNISSPEELAGYASTAEQIADWFTRYATELRERAEHRPLRAVR